MWEFLRPLIFVLLCNVLFLFLCSVPVVLLARIKRPAYAVLKRNFVGYFMNPTGYAFLVLFVFLCSLAQFWPHEFFNANLATLDQLTLWFPLIMLSFIPAITMSIWADERRQGTDELLLTIPANDFDIVIGKYLGIAAIFTVSLLFSQITILLILDLLSHGNLDAGLFISTYLGYWLTGLAMLAMGMVGSFLTSNVTISFMLAALINLPLVALAWADVIVPTSRSAQYISRLSIAGQMRDFASGVVSLSSTSYFVLLTVLGLFLSMVLIGRRHWMGGRTGQVFALHYIARAVCLAMILVGANLVLANHDWRPDLTRDQVNRLHPDTLRLIAEFEPEHPVVIEAYISEDMPELFAPTRHELVALLREFDARGGDKIEVRLHEDIPVYSDTAVLANERYGIEPETVVSTVRGAPQEEEIIMGAGFTMGLDQEVVPFFNNGIPVEYELIRTLVMLAEKDRQKIGIVKTDAQLMGGMSFSMGGVSRVPPQLIIGELEKQYEVIEVDPTNPIEDTFDMLLVVQPSSLTQPQIDHLVAAVTRGVPTAIFEDPIPYPGTWTEVAGTDQPRRGGGGMPGMQMQPEPKGSLNPLWDLLGVELLENEVPRPTSRISVVWQAYNPYPQIRGYREITDEWVFIRQELPPPPRDPFNLDLAVTRGLEELLFIYPGAIHQRELRGLEFTSLVRTSKLTGVIGSDRRGRVQTGNSYVLAARIQGKDRDTAEVEDISSLISQLSGEHEHSHEGDAHDHDHAADSPEDSAADGSQRPIDVILVSDIDVLGSLFLQLRARPTPQLRFRFDNVTFVLNVIDELAGEDRFMEIRKHKRSHVTLEEIEWHVQRAQEDQQKERAKFESELQSLQDEADAARRDAEIEDQIRQVEEIREVFQKRQQEMDSRGDELSEAEQRVLEVLSEKIEEFTTLRKDFRRHREENPTQTNPRLENAISNSCQNILTLARRTGLITNDEFVIANQRASLQTEEMVRRLLANLTEKIETSEREVKRIETELEIQIQRVQNRYKLAAVFYPPIPPMLIGLLVYVRRRVREKVGVSRERLR